MEFIKIVDINSPANLCAYFDEYDAYSELEDEGVPLKSIYNGSLTKEQIDIFKELLTDSFQCGAQLNIEITKEEPDLSKLTIKYILKNIEEIDPDPPDLEYVGYELYKIGPYYLLSYGMAV